MEYQYVTFTVYILDLGANSLESLRSFSPFAIFYTNSISKITVYFKFRTSKHNCSCRELITNYSFRYFIKSEAILS